MLIKKALETPAAPVDGLKGVTIRWLWASTDGAPTFALRLLEVEPGAATFRHAHPYEHEVYVLSGRAVAHSETGEFELGAGSTALVMPNEIHQFINRGDETLRFLCAIPVAPPTGDKK
jgi:quercetin dioxygenase-like cupin family protein